MDSNSRNIQPNNQEQKIYDKWKDIYKIKNGIGECTEKNPLKCVDQILKYARDVLGEREISTVEYLDGCKDLNKQIGDEGWVIGKKLSYKDFTINVRIDYDGSKGKANILSLGPHINIECFSEEDKKTVTGYHIKNININYGADGSLKYVLWGKLCLYKDAILKGELSSTYIKNYRLF
jgi:hypothetical protein